MQLNGDKCIVVSFIHEQYGDQIPRFFFCKGNMYIYLNANILDKRVCFYVIKFL